MDQVHRGGPCRGGSYFCIRPFKSDTAVLTFTFCFLSSPIFSLFLPEVCFCFARHLVVFILVGKDFRKGFRILELDKRKGRWVVEQDFHEIFRSMLHSFLPFPPVSLTELSSF